MHIIMLFSNLFSRNTAYRQMIFLAVINGIFFFSVFTILGYTEFNFIPLIWIQYQTTKYSPAAIPSKHVLSALE